MKLRERNAKTAQEKDEVRRYANLSTSEDMNKS